MIIKHVEVDKVAYNLEKYKANIFYILVKVDASESIEGVIREINDESWINKLIQPEDMASYSERRKKTAEIIVSNCAKQINGVKTGDFDYSTIGEYIVSREGRVSLHDVYSHNIIPLAELWKERKGQNGGFDFHTESPTSMVLIFGEAKYNSKSNPFNDAIPQVERFIIDKKDIKELSDLKNLVSNRKYTENVVNGKKGYAIAFSIKANDPQSTILNAINSSKIINIANYDEFYVVGVMINDK